MPLDFALIAHQESWKAAADVLSVLRGPALPPIDDIDLRELFPWIPPRAVCRVELTSTLGHTVRGVYIDAFIPPDRLGHAHVRENVGRVRAAAACAVREGARIVSLGGFSSILIEGDTNLLPDKGDTVFTTGNTLTVSLIVEGVLSMYAKKGRDLADSTLLIVGATGDVGSGCARCIAPMVKHVVLNARAPGRLQTLAAELRELGASVDIATDLQGMNVQVDIVICVASLESSSLLLDCLGPDAIVCDAGYPKNLSPANGTGDPTVFFGGLGQATGGILFQPDVHRVLHHHPFPNIAQGCMLEGMVLALEGRFEPFSYGRGFITPERVAEIGAIARRHGIQLAPFHNATGAVNEFDRELQEQV